MAEFQGQLASFDAEQGFGFITPASGTIVPDPDGTQGELDALDEDVFVSGAQFRSDGLTPGQAVTFDIQVDLDGLEAVNVSAA